MEAMATRRLKARPVLGLKRDYFGPNGAHHFGR
jgi:hypothetical protein